MFLIRKKQEEIKNYLNKVDRISYFTPNINDLEKILEDHKSFYHLKDRHNNNILHFLLKEVLVNSNDLLNLLPLAISKGACLNQYNDSGHTPFMQSIIYDVPLEVCLMLFEYNKSQIFQKRKTDKSSSLHLLSSTPRLDKFLYFINYFDDINERNAKYETALDFALTNHNFVIAKELIVRGATFLWKEQDCFNMGISSSLFFDLKNYAEKIQMLKNLELL